MVTQRTETTTTLDKMLRAFPDATFKESNGWYSHADNPKFDFRATEKGYIIISSWTNRSREDILQMGGLTEKDVLGSGTSSYTREYTQDAIDVFQLSQAKRIHHSYLNEWGISDGYRYNGRPYVRIPYPLPDGTYHSKIKVRKAISGEYKHCWDEGTPGDIIPYGLDKLHMAYEQGFLFIPEGETDAWTYWYHNFPALSIPGADMAKALDNFAFLLSRIPHIYIIEEPDQAKKLQWTGQGFYKNVHNKLRKLGYKGAISCVQFEQITGCKDPNELHIKMDAWLLENKQSFRNMILQTKENAIPANDGTPVPDNSDIITISDAPTDEALLISSKDLCTFSDDDAGNGDAMDALYGKSMLYCAARGWFYYNGKHWKLDDDGATVRRRAVETLRRRRHAAVDEEKEAIIKCTKADDKRVNGCINRFKTLVSVNINEFDNNPDLLNCKNGVLNLRTGELTQHSYTQRVTYCLHVAYVERTCEEWLDYLRDVVGGGQEVIDYLQMALGYSLTGHTREEILFYLFGPSRSGKGTLAEVFMSLLPHPISTMVDFNTFTAKREGDVSNFDLAPLKPNRLVFASESNRNQSLNPAKIKQLTGGDSITASFKHKDFFTYRPQFKMWMMSNQSVNGDPDDDALWGRVRVIEFPHSFLGREDKTKKARLKETDALEAILYWAVQGVFKWYSLGASGLQTPVQVVKATQQHRDELDYIQQWLDECTEKDADGWTSNEGITGSYTTWCENNNVQFTKGPKALSQSLKSKGYKVGEVRKINGKTCRGVEGLTIG